MLKKINALIGCSIPLIHSGLSDDHFFIQVLDGITRICEKTGYSPVLYTSSDYLQSILEKSIPNMDGFILFNPLIDNTIINKLKKLNIPFVVIGAPDNNSDIFSVDIDVIGAAFQVSNFLINKGHKNIFYINSPNEYVHTSQNKEGFKLAHEENDIPWLDEYYTEQPVTSLAGFSLCEEILQNNPDCSAIVTTNEIVAKGVMDNLNEKNIRIPKKMAIISMGGTPIGSFCRPGITTIDFSPVNLGTVATNLLVEVISKKRIRPSHLLLPTRLIEREST